MKDKKVTIPFISILFETEEGIVCFKTKDGIYEIEKKLINDVSYYELNGETLDNGKITLSANWVTQKGLYHLVEEEQ